MSVEDNLPWTSVVIAICDRLQMFTSIIAIIFLQNFIQLISFIEHRAQSGTVRRDSRGDMASCRSVNHDRRRSLRHDYQVWINSVACEGEDQLNRGHSRDALANFRKLKHSPCESAPSNHLVGRLGAERQAKQARQMDGALLHTA